MRKSLWFSVFTVGFSSILAQIIILREALSGFYGNELILGIVLGNWLLLTGVGTHIGSKSEKLNGKTNIYSLTQILIPFLAVFMIYSVRAFRNYFFTSGELIGLIPAYIFSLVFLAPFCIISGFQYTLASDLASVRRRRKVYELSNVYVVNMLGHLSGGFLASFLLIPLLNSFQLIYLIACFSLLSAFILARDIGDGKLVGLCIAGFIAFTILTFASIDFDYATTQLQYPDQNLIRIQDSIYGRIVVTETDGQLNFYENAFPLFSTGDGLEREELVHYGMLQHASPANVLLISGGVSGTLKEIMKYNPSVVDYVEIDPVLIEVGGRYTDHLDDDRVNVHNVDGRAFIRQTRNRYDVVLIDLPDPSSLQVNRFYTLEFLKGVRDVLEKDGVVSLSLSGGGNYLSDEERLLNAALYQTLRQVFSNVLIIPGTMNYYVSSDAQLDYGYQDKLAGGEIRTQYLEYYLPATLTEDRISYVNDAVDVETKLNKDFTPITHLYYFRHWMNIFKVNYVYVLALVLAVIFVALHVSKIEPIPLTILATGFTAMTLELVLIVSFQILYGYIYHKIGLIVTAFMLGAVIGAYTANRYIKDRRVSARFLSKFDFMMSAYCIALSVILVSIGTLTPLAAQVSIPFLAFVIGVLVGGQFPIAVKTYHVKTGKTVETVRVLASLDLFGACIGALLVSIFLIPVLGVVKVCVLAGIINLVSGAYVWIKG